MDEIPAAAAARRLGISEPAVRKMISAGRLPNLARTGPALVASADVDSVMRERWADAAQRHPDQAAFARQIRGQLWPGERIERVTLEDGRRVEADGVQALHLIQQPSGRAVLPLLHHDAVALFGRAAVEIAATDPKTWQAGACRWCFANCTAEIDGGLKPDNTPAYRILMGCAPCPLDHERWQAEAAERRASLARFRVSDRTRREEAQRLRARREFHAAQADAERAQNTARAAASRLRSASRAYATLDPSAAAQAAVQGRRLAGFTASGDLPCGCSSEVYCSAHASLFGTHDRRQARR